MNFSINIPIYIQIYNSRSFAINFANLSLCHFCLFFFFFF
jgi:hypothetical protein